MHLIFLKALTICEQLFADFPVLREVYEEGSFSKMSDARFCGKMKVLDELLEAMKKSNDKVLVFSTSVQVGKHLIFWFRIALKNKIDIKTLFNDLKRL